MTEFTPSEILHGACPELGKILRLAQNDAKLRGVRARLKARNALRKASEKFNHSRDILFRSVCLWSSAALGEDRDWDSLSLRPPATRGRGMCFSYVARIAVH